MSRAILNDTDESGASTHYVYFIRAHPWMGQTQHRPMCTPRTIYGDEEVGCRGAYWWGWRPEKRARWKFRRLYKIGSKVANSDLRSSLTGGRFYIIRAVTATAHLHSKNFSRCDFSWFRVFESNRDYEQCILIPGIRLRVFCHGKDRVIELKWSNKRVVKEYTTREIPARKFIQNNFRSHPGKAVWKTRKVSNSETFLVHSPIQVFFVSCEVAVWLSLDAHPECRWIGSTYVHKMYVHIHYVKL